ncbi:MAG TPA: carbon storage regulator CsrA [Pseudomonas sp.]|jgi:carbon storage regulator
MLVLTREVGETFSIGDDVIVQILSIQGNQVRFGITAPTHVKIHRAEVYRRIANRLSQQHSPTHDARQP